MTWQQAPRAGGSRAGGSEAVFEGEGGLFLRYRAWPAPEGAAALLLVHGQGEHAGRYAQLAGELVGRGIGVYALDQRGHGRSPGRRGHVRRFSELTGDVERFRRSVAATLPEGMPLFLMGHSLGGLVALRYLQTYPATGLRGAVLSAPALGIAFDPPAWKTIPARVLTHLWPTMRFAHGIEPAHLSRDPAVVAAYRKDPLVHPWVTPRFYTEAVAAMRAARAEGDRVRLPLLLLVPGDDRIVPSELALEFARTLPEPPEVRRYQESYHESFNEPERERVVRDVADWLLERAA